MFWCKEACKMNVYIIPKNMDHVEILINVLFYPYLIITEFHYTGTFSTLSIDQQRKFGDTFNVFPSFRMEMGSRSKIIFKVNNFEI